MDFKKMVSDKYAGRRVLIFGLGLHGGGVGSAEFFAEAGAEVRVTDLKTESELAESVATLRRWPNITFRLGEHRDEDVDWAELVVRNPAVRDSHPLIVRAAERGVAVEQDVGIFLQLIDRDRLIGVTGTKGKSTVVAATAFILKEAGYSVVVAGNIGMSVLKVLPQIEADSWVILELSSFQLLSFEQHGFSPHIAAITNIFPDHLDYHGSMEAYVAAKRNIAAFQQGDDFLLLNRQDAVTNSSRFLHELPAARQQIDTINWPTEIQPKLVGQDNLRNLLMAVRLAELAGVESEQAFELAAMFTGAEYRLQDMGWHNGLRVINDSASTNPRSTISAVSAYPASLVIVGGVDKGLPYKEMAAVLDREAAAIFLLDGTASAELMRYLTSERVFGPFGSLNELLEMVWQVAEDGQTLVFSPGAASFNMFANEFDRGWQFNQLLQDLK